MNCRADWGDISGVVGLGFGFSCFGTSVTDRCNACEVGVSLLSRLCIVDSAGAPYRIWSDRGESVVNDGIV